MKTRFAPHWYRPGVDNEFHSRRSGLPIGYFDPPPWYMRWAVITALLTMLFTCSSVFLNP